ncbi:MAG: DUF4433 domain-containing protein [Parcubacteria group bacterium]
MQASPKIYHITHVDNLAAIVAAGRLRSDAAMIARGGPKAAIGMGAIKARRMSLPVDCHPGTAVGEYVPFYFCSRSIMLYVLHMANAEELEYRGGQGPIVHLEADLHQVVKAADAAKVRWAFSLSNAGALYTEFRKDLAALGELNWDAIAARDFRSQEVKEGKQAEFLVYGTFPWKMVSRIGVRSQAIRTQVEALLHGAEHHPPVELRPEWYY